MNESNNVNEIEKVDGTHCNAIVNALNTFTMAINEWWLVDRP